LGQRWPSRSTANWRATKKHIFPLSGSNHDGWVS
jgi:hypothetical protein